MELSEWSELEPGFTWNKCCDCETSPALTGEHSSYKLKSSRDCQITKTRLMQGKIADNQKHSPQAQIKNTPWLVSEILRSADFVLHNNLLGMVSPDKTPNQITREFNGQMEQ